MSIDKSFGHYEKSKLSKEHGGLPPELIGNLWELLPESRDRNASTRNMAQLRFALSLEPLGVILDPHSRPDEVAVNMGSLVHYGTDHLVAYISQE